MEDLVRIPAGPFLFGASEQQFQFFLSLSIYNFPGMVQISRYGSENARTIRHALPIGEHP